MSTGFSSQEQDEPLNLCVRDLVLQKSGLEMTELEESEVPLGTPDSSSQPETPSSEHGSSPGFMYWPNPAGVFIHPMALQSQFLYYQKMGEQHKNPFGGEYCAPQEPMKIVPKTQSSTAQDVKCSVPAVPRVQGSIGQNAKR